MDLRARETLEDTPPPVAKRIKHGNNTNTFKMPERDREQAMCVLEEYKYLEGEVR
jgi:hypothetical protein